MQHYLVNRIVAGLMTLIGATIIIFTIMRVLPGDVVLSMLASSGGDISRVDPQKLKEVKTMMGFDDPIYVQYGNWMLAIAKGEMGNSILRKENVRELIQARAPLTVQLAIQSVVLSWLIGLPLGIISALRQNSWADYVSRIGAIITMAMPAFWLGGLAIIALVGFFGWYPPIGYKPPWQNIAHNLQQLLLPSLILGAGMAASIARMSRSSILEVIREDYVRTAWAKGLREQAIVRRHVLKAALLPVITISGLQFAAILGGSVVIESVFGLQGLGALLMASVLSRDYIVVQNLVFIFAAGYIVINLLVDLAYGWLDPRVHYS